MASLVSLIQYFALGNTPIVDKLSVTLCLTHLPGVSYFLQLLDGMCDSFRSSIRKWEFANIIIQTQLRNVHKVCLFCTRSRDSQLYWFPSTGSVHPLESIASQLKSVVYGIQCTKDAPLTSVSALATYYIEVGFILLYTYISSLSILKLPSLSNSPLVQILKR